MSALILMRDSARLCGYDCGQGPPSFFQHGLGGDVAQVAEAFPAAGRRRLTLECPAHGASQAGDGAAFSIARFADDVLAFADARGLERFAIGGISMGAAIAMRIAVARPERVAALILARPAWGWTGAPENMRPFTEVARHLHAGGRAAFERSDMARRLALEAPDNFSTLLSFFDRPNPDVLSALLGAIARDGPGVGEAEIRSIALPTLVLGNAMDAVHPIALARRLAAAIPGAKFVELTPKALDKPRHLAELRAAINSSLAARGF